VKWTLNRGFASSQVADVLVLVGGVVVHHQMELDRLAGLGVHGVAVGPLDLTCRNARNSWWRCLGLSAAVTWPVAMSSAPNRVVVPCR
jgi:hypothetical protein